MGQKPKTIPPPDFFALSAAMGWVELGNPAEALLELDRITPRYREHSDVLEMRWQIWARMERWETCLPVAEKMCDVAPDRPQGWLHQAVSLYRLKRTREAWTLLLPKAEIFPNSWVIPYDLSCYACQLGNFDEARTWLKKAFQMAGEKEAKQIALADPDLEKLWPEIKAGKFA